MRIFLVVSILMAMFLLGVQLGLNTASEHINNQAHESAVEYVMDQGCYLI